MTRRKRKKWAFLAAAVVVAGVGITLGLTLSGGSGSSPSTAEQGNGTYTVGRGDIENTLTVYGEVVPAQEYTFTFDGDDIVEIFVKAGNRVEAGDVLVELDKTQAELDLLAATRALSEAEADGIPAIIAERELAYEIALQRYEDTTLRAPFAGVVADISQATTSSEAWRIELIDTSELYVEAEVDQLDAPNLTVGQTATAVIEPLPDQMWEVEIVEIGGMAIESGSSTVVVISSKLPVADPSILVGYTVEMEVITASATDVLRVPVSSLIENPKGWMVMKVVDSEVSPQPVTIGVTSNDYVEVSGGLAEGDVILLYPSTSSGDRPERPEGERPAGAMPSSGGPSGGFPGK